MAVERKTSDTASQNEQPFLTSSNSWTPFSLRRSIIIGLAVVAAALVIVLAALKLVSDRNNGLCDAQSNDHYLWTYAPTALFTVFAAAWTQVEFRAKQMQPWRSMSESEQRSSEGVLLDYVSPWAVIVLYRAAKKRHGVVVAAVMGSFLLQLLIVLSTGLLTLSQVEVHISDASLVATNRFITNEADLELHRVDELPAALTVGVSQNIIDLPPYTTREAAFQHIVPLDSHPTGVRAIKAEVEVLSSSMHCEEATISFRRRAGYVWYRDHAAWFATGFNSSSYGECEFPGWGNGPNYDTFNPMGDTYCKTHTCAKSFDCSPNQSSILKDAPTDPVLLWFAASAFDQVMPGTLCWPKFELKKQQVTFDGPSISRISGQLSSKEIQLPNWRGQRIYSAFQNSVGAGRPGGSGILSPTQVFKTQFSSDEWIFLSVLNPQATLTDFEDPKLVIAMFQNAWSAFTGQLFSLYFLQEADVAMKGTIVTQRQRLVMRPVSFWLAEVCLVILFALAFALALMKSHKYMRCDPSSIAGLASILCTSPALVQLLHHTGISTEGQLHSVLSDKRFELEVTHTTTAVHSSESNLRAGCSPTPHKDLKSREIHWYRPFSTRTGLAYGTCIALVAFIVILQVLLYESQSEHGLAYVSKPESYEHYAFTFLPALVMVSVSVIVGIQHGTVKMFSPYVALSRGIKDARATILRKPFSNVNLYLSLQNRETYVIASTVAVFAGWYLTIVVSGLYTAALVPSSRQTSLQQSDWFNTNINDGSLISPRTPFQIEMVLNGNSSYPKFTYDTLALSRFDPPTEAVKGQLEIQALPAIRGNMNCTLIPNGDIINAELISKGFDDPFASLLKHQDLIVHIRNMPPCTGFQSGSGTIDYWHSYNKTAKLTVFAPIEGYFGGLMPGGSLALREAGPGSRCPGYIGAIGEIKQKKVESLTIIACDPFATKETIDVTFGWPSRELDLNNPPVVRDSASQVLDIGFGKQGFYNPFATFQDIGRDIYHQHREMAIDYPMKALVFGSRGIPLHELTGEKNRNRFMNAVEHLYGLAFAQLMDGARIGTDPSNSSSMQATISTPDGYRLKQSALSTHILSGLLAIILVAIVITAPTMNTKRVLPKNPCSIAAVGSLLADSDFLGMVKPDFQRLSERQFAAEVDGYTFSMGWWTGGECDLGRRRFGIDFGRAEHLR